MKTLGKFFFWFFVLLVSFNIVLFAISYDNNLKFKALSNLASPLPRLLSDNSEYRANSAVFWQPSLETLGTSQKKPQITALSALSYDIESNKIIFEENIDQRLPIASLTKIMTAIVALENFSLDEEITVTKSASNIGEDSMGLSYLEKFKLEDLLYGLMLKSGNDAAEAISQSAPFGRDNFIHLMNKKAEDLGLSHTRFTNPTGLQGDGLQYSTAKELLALTHYALQKKEFSKIVATYEYDIPQTTEHKEYILYNETNLLTTYPGVKGVKTGFTDEAGLCLITYLEYKGHKIIAILLNSQNRRFEMAEILDYSLKSLGIAPPPHN